MKRNEVDTLYIKIDKLGASLKRRINLFQDNWLVRSSSDRNSIGNIDNLVKVVNSMHSYLVKIDALLDRSFTQNENKDKVIARLVELLEKKGG